MTDAERLSKNAKIAESQRSTIERHSKMSCKSYTVKIQSNKLSVKQQDELHRLFLEAKWFKNYVLDWCNKSEDNKLSKFDTKIKNITHKDKDMNDIDVELKQISSQMKQSIVKELISNTKTIKTLKKNGYQKNGGRLKFSKEIKSISLKQFNNSYFIKSDNKIKIQGVHGKLQVNGMNQFMNIPNIEFANARILNRPDGYYIQFVTYQPKILKDTPKNDIVGIDFGCSTSLSLSNGLKINVSVQESELLKRLSVKMNRRQKKGSKNWYKTVKKIKKEYQKLSNIKNNISNQIVSYLLSNYETIVIQDEQLHSWHKGNHSKAIQHSILGRVKSKLIASDRCIVLSKWLPTSKFCSHCGQVHSELKLWDRIFTCDCGINSQDRDIHAAQNMIWFYYDKIKVPTEHREFKPVEIEASVFEVFSNISYISAKQEAAWSLDKR